MKKLAVTVAVALCAGCPAYASEVEDPNFLRKVELIDEIFGEDYTGNTFGADDSRIDDLISELWPSAGQQDSAPTQTASQIDKHDQRIQTLETRIARDRERLTNTIAEVEALAPVSVADTKRKAEVNSRAIDTLADQISALDNREAVAGHGTALTEHDGRITAQAGRITMNADALGTHKTQIASLGTGLSTAQEGVSANSGKLTMQAADITENSAKLGEHEETLEAHNGRITANTSSITENTNAITANVRTLEEHGEKLTTQGNLIEEHAGRIEANESQVASNLQAIEGLDEELYGEAEPNDDGERVSRIDVNEENIAAHGEQLSAHEERISANVTAIDTLKGVDVALGKRIATNEKQIARNMERIDSNTVGVAAAIALASIPPLPEGHDFAVGGGFGHWDSEPAVALNAQARVQNAVLHAAVTGNADEIGVGTGVTFGW